MPAFARVARGRRALWPALALLVALLAAAGAASAQTTLLGSVPDANATLPVGPRRIELYLAEPAAPGSVAVRLIGVAGAEFASVPAAVDAADPRHAVADLPAQPPAGDWTVGWTARPAAGGAPLAGSFPFRVGAVGPPGAAATTSDLPAAWAVAARGLFALGVALAAGGALLGRVAAPGLVAAAPAAGRRVGLAAAGATVALLATLAEPLLLSRFPPADQPVSFSQAFAGMPPGWLLRVAAALLLALLPLSLLARGREAATRPAWTDWATLALALVAAGALTWSGHPAAAGPALDAAGVAHVAAATLLAGGAIVLAASRGAPPAGGTAAPGRRMAWLGVALAVVAVVAGVAAATAAITRPSDLWGDAYGWVLLVKLALLLPLLWLVARAALRRRGWRASGILLPIAAAGAALALLVGAALPLVAKPGAEMDPTLTGVDLAAALPIGAEGAAGRLHLALQPARPGPNTLVVRLSDAEGRVLPASQAPMLQVDLRPLDHAGAARSVNPVLDAGGGYAVAGVDLASAGWWQATITVVPPDGNAQQVPYYFVLPDPNVTGAGPRPSSDPRARPVFDRAMAVLGQLRAIRYTQRLSDGTGFLYQSLIAVTDARDGQEQAFQETTPDREAVIVGDTMWIRENGQPWEERAGASIPLPSTWSETYVDGQGFRLGPVEAVNGQQAQVVTFYLPRTPRTAPAWYAWWVSLQSGHILREAMVSTRHYMIYNFSDFNADIRITPPAPRQGPPGETPAATPTG